MSIEELIVACKKNDREAQKMLYRSYKDTLYLQSLKYSKCPEEAEDILHDAFITIFSKIKSYSKKGSFEGWMKRIVINKSIDNYKKRKNLTNDLKEHFLKNVEADVEVSENINISLNKVLEYIQELPDQYRLVFNLYQLDGYSHKEIAKMLSISESTSKSNFHRAKLSLKEKLQKDKYLNLEK
ncbi:MAG: RNA polymerase sigma factor [Flavobacteriaceae bacterium]